MSSSLAEQTRPWWSLKVPRGIADDAALRRATTLLWCALGFAIAFMVTYWMFVLTLRGQRWDDAAWLGFKYRDGDYVLGAKATLRQISIPSLIVASAVLGVVAWIRGGLRTAMGIGLYLLITLIVVEALKHWILPRPELYEFGPLRRAYNTLPSGHTTIGAMIAVGLVLVMPRQFRGITTIVAAAYAAEVGVATLGAGWHRPSDAIAAYWLVGMGAMIVVALMLRRGTARVVAKDELGPLRGWSLVVWLVPVVAVLALIGSMVITSQVWPWVVGSEPPTAWPIATLDQAFAAGALADYAAAGFLFTVLYLALRRIDLGLGARARELWMHEDDDVTVNESEPTGSLAAPAPLPDVSLLPDTTSDEGSTGWGDRADDDRRYLDDVPPHHGA